MAMRKMLKVWRDLGCDWGWKGVREEFVYLFMRKRRLHNSRVIPNFQSCDFNWYFAHFLTRTSHTAHPDVRMPPNKRFKSDIWSHEKSRNMETFFIFQPRGFVVQCKSHGNIAITVKGMWLLCYSVSFVHSVVANLYYVAFFLYKNLKNESF